MVTSLAPAGFTRRAVEALSERFVEPAWMREFRLEAFDAFERLPIPTTADEAHRRGMRLSGGQALRREGGSDGRYSSASRCHSDSTSASSRS